MLDPYQLPLADDRNGYPRVDRIDRVAFVAAAAAQKPDDGKEHEQFFHENTISSVRTPTGVKKQKAWCRKPISVK